MQTLRLVAVLAAFLIALPAQSAEQEAPPSEVSPLAVGASLVPGVLLHGAGHFVMGERQSAYRLLAMEGVGLAGIIGGLGMLVAVGGSEKLAGAYVPLLVGGVGLFTVSFLADVAGTLHGPGLWHLPNDPIGLRFRGGYAGLFGSNHDFHHLGALGVSWEGDRLVPEGQATLHPRGAYSDYRGLMGWRVWTREGDPVTRLHLLGEFARQDFQGERMSITTGRIFGELRWNFGDLVPTMQNAWLLARFGVGLDAFGFDDAPVSDDGLPFMVADIGMGLMIGPRVSAELVYRHRKGELPGGMALSDGMTGFAGMLELKSRVTVTKYFAVVPGLRLGTGVMPWVWIESRLF